MKILLTNHQMADFGGSEVFTWELAKELKRWKHDVTVYSRYVDKFVPLFEARGIRLVTDLATIKDEKFDVAHVQQNLCVLEVRDMFPQLPIFCLSHGVTAFLETPPKIDCNVTTWGAVSKRVGTKNLEAHGIKKYHLVNNIIDSNTFQCYDFIGRPMEHALIISHHMSKEQQAIIERACKNCGMTVERVGRPYKVVPNDQMADKIRRSDVVFTLGRGAMEAMMCGVTPFILDYKGGDGLVTMRNFNKLAEYHFNGCYKKKQWTAFEIELEIKNKWTEDLGPKLHGKMEPYYPWNVRIELERIYRETIANYTDNLTQANRDHIHWMVQAIHVTRLHTFSRSEPYLVRPKNWPKRILRKIYNKLP